MDFPDEEEQEEGRTVQMYTISREGYQQLMAQLGQRTGNDLNPVGVRFLASSDDLITNDEEDTLNAPPEWESSKAELGPPITRPTENDDYIDFGAHTLKKCWAALEQNKIPPTDQTFRLALTEGNLQELREKLLSVHTSKHLLKQRPHSKVKIEHLVQAIPSVVWPLNTKADGNCLLYSVAKCIFGVEEKFNEVLRTLIVRELTEYMGFYVNAVDKKNEDEKCYSDDEYSEFIRQASENRRFLGLIHIFALSNILRRPILLYSNEVDMSRWGVHENGIAGLFLPTRQGPYRVTGPPIAIAWSDEAHDHFVPLVQLDPTIGFEWPLLSLVYRRTLQEGENISDYIQYDFPAQRKELGFHALIEAQKGWSPDSLSRSIAIERYGNAWMTTTVDFPIVFSLNGDTNLLWANKEESVVEHVQRWWIGKTGRTVCTSSEKPLLEKVAQMIHTRLEDFQKRPLTHTYPIRRPTNLCPFVEIPTKPGNKLYVKITDLNPKIMSVIQTKNRALRQGQQYQFTLNSTEEGTFSKVVECLSRQSIDHMQVFLGSTLDMIQRMVYWPEDQVFPVIDVLRVLILNESAANYYVKQSHQRWDNCLFDSILKIFYKDTLRWENCFVIIKFIINMFYQPCMKPVLAAHGNNIMKTLLRVVLQSNYEKNRANIVKNITYLLFNFSVFWRETKGIELHAQDSMAKSCLTIVSTLLAEIKTDESDLRLLQTYCYILAFDGFLEGCPSIDLSPYCSSANAETLQVANFIIHLLESRKLSHSFEISSINREPL